MKIIIPILSFLLFYYSGLVVSSPTIEDEVMRFYESKVDSILDADLDSVCKKFPTLPKNSCEQLVTAGIRSKAGLTIDMEALKESIKNPVLINSVLPKSFDKKIPLSLEFKTFDSKDGEDSLGLYYSFDYDLLRLNNSENSDWTNKLDLVFSASGTVTNISENNPRNFLDTKFALSNAYTTRIPVQSKDFGGKLTNAASVAARACANKEFSKTESCIKTKEKAFALLDSTSDFLRAFQRYELGVDIGIESNQTFDVSQTKFGVFVNGQYESWGTNTFIGGLGITPAFRLAVDNVSPDNDTYRALAGDDSSFYRIASEISLWMPVGTYLNKKIVFTLNYRNYSEISPSSIVKSAGLDVYNLVTISLSMPTGLFASYSSGELPLDQKSDNVLELGWKTYF